MIKTKVERHGFLKWYLTVLIDNYANFSGRARRQEYWIFILFQFVIFISLGFMSAVTEDLFETQLFGIVVGIYLLGTLIPWLAVNIRRLHDTGKSGGYFFVNLIPLIGRIWYLILMCTDGNANSNQYGPNPKVNNDFDEIDEIGKPLSNY
ncbi:DUF805 domain-containing protein [Flavivirga jejuensis]|uniref:DUF805 domain-containing protein n=1 Tax=Flavivirga jejuensis TaxID=870487 RepID=A0ABT8WJV0_9FLAO|nr:DUF805 domain-containing protein [Flavivirga jejuensis]MDO5973398.1 DUF805 domain-containing protein [Flavivirga jejuensis]